MNNKSLEQKYKELINFNRKAKLWENGFLYFLTHKKALNVFTKLTKSPIDWTNMWIATLISNSTYGSTTPEKVKNIFESAIQNKIIKDFKASGKQHIITLNDDSTVKFVRITDFFQGIENDQPDLLTEARSGHCHINAFLFSAGFDLPHSLCSGLCTNQSKKRSFPHSWIEFEYNGNNFVIDYNYNAIINKSGFDKLFSPQKVVRIDGKQVVSDEKLLRQTLLLIEILECIVSSLMMLEKKQ